MTDAEHHRETMDKLLQLQPKRLRVPLSGPDKVVVLATLHELFATLPRSDRLRLTSRWLVRDLPK